jgi:hypothetical protein
LFQLPRAAPLVQLYPCVTHAMAHGCP